MTCEYPILDIPDLGSLQPGEWSLSAPVIDEVVQVGWSADDAAHMPKTGLRVAIADDSVNVSRLDGRPLQFGVISGEFGRLTTHLVPPEPTASITYQAAGRNKWTVSSELDITIPDDGAPQRIAAAIIRFVSAKQSQ